jgi:hypothetical protein
VNPQLQTSALLRRLAGVPAWAWLALAGLLVTPLYLKYFAWVLGGCVQFWAPMR